MLKQKASVENEVFCKIFEKILKTLLNLNYYPLNQIKQLKERYQNLEIEFGNLSKFSIENDDVDNFFEKMIDEVNSKKHLVDKILPKEIDSLKKYGDSLEKLDLNNQTGSGYLENLNKKIRLLSAEINKEIEKRMLNEDSVDDKLVTFKQNAAIIGKKKATLEKTFKELEDEVSEFKKLLNEKMYDKDGVKKLVGEELKSYVNAIRQKQADHKDKKKELNELRNEIGLQTRTLEILEKERKSLNDELIRLEEDKGILGYFSNQDNLKIVENFEKESEQNRGELLNCIEELNNKISANKNDLQPLIKELKPLRNEQQNLQSNYDEVKSKYDSVATSLDGKFVNLKQEVKQLEQQAHRLESDLFKLDCDFELLSAKKKWIEENHSEIGENKIIENIQDEISLVNKNLDNLTEKHQQLKENNQSKKQIEYWKFVEQLMRIKNDIYLYNNEKNEESKKRLTKDFLTLNN